MSPKHWQKTMEKFGIIEMIDKFSPMTELDKAKMQMGLQKMNTAEVHVLYHQLRMREMKEVK